MKSLNCFCFLTTVGFFSMFLIGCVEFDSDVGNSLKFKYANLKWSNEVRLGTFAQYSYSFEKSEEEVLRTCLASARHYPPTPKGVVADRFCFDNCDILFYLALKIDLDGEEWEVCKVRNKWHAHFDIADRDAEMKLYSLLQKILEKQPPYTLEPLPKEIAEELPPHFRNPK